MFKKLPCTSIAIRNNAVVAQVRLMRAGIVLFETAEFGGFANRERGTWANSDDTAASRRARLTVPPRFEPGARLGFHILCAQEIPALIANAVPKNSLFRSSRQYARYSTSSIVTLGALINAAISRPSMQTGTK